jgi:hypothetical protein
VGNLLYFCSPTTSGTGSVYSLSLGAPAFTLFKSEPSLGGLPYTSFSRGRAPSSSTPSSLPPRPFLTPRSVATGAEGCSAVVALVDVRAKVLLGKRLRP